MDDYENNYAESGISSQKVLDEFRRIGSQSPAAVDDGQPANSEQVTPPSVSENVEPDTGIDTALVLKEFRAIGRRSHERLKLRKSPS